jgi:ADP-ribose pyrophosphatase YjhB (NUDIX family)
MTKHKLRLNQKRRKLQVNKVFKKLIYLYKIGLPIFFMTDNNNNKLFCTNCGSNEHKMRDCNQPITSYGMILYTYDPKKNKLMFLMICRKNTIGFVELIRGRYNPNDLHYLNALTRVLTTKEASECLEKTHDELWTEICYNKNNKSEYWKKELKNSQSKWTQSTDIIRASISQMNHRYEYPEWGFPKGRRNYKERSLQTAMRELYEETSITGDSYSIINIEPVIEEYISYDSRSYRNIYYIARLNTWVNLDIKEHNEVSRVRLLTYDTCINRIRNYEEHKKVLLNNVNNMLIKLHNIT